MIIKENSVNSFVIDNQGTIYKVIAYSVGYLPIDCKIVRIGEFDERRLSNMRIGDVYSFTKEGYYRDSDEIIEKYSLKQYISKEENPEYFLWL